MMYTIKWLDKVNLNINNDTLEILLESSGNINRKNRLINKIVSVVKNTDILDPVSIVINTYNSPRNIEKSEEVEVEKSSNVHTYIEKEEKPIVYIYNTHQTEKYSSSKEINLKYSVMDASYYLQKELKKYGIESLVENGSISDILNTNNWNYASSYRVSRMFLEKSKENNDALTYFIDLHRDSVNKNISTIEINGKKYARTMFLIGLENKDYKKNEVIVNKLENWLNTKYKGLSRGIYRKQGKGVNGVYNQDFSEYCILIEVGGEENTMEEVENTIEVIAEMLNYLIGEKND